MKTNNNIVIALDLETCCDVSGCPGFGKSDGSCDHALDFNRNRITKIGLYYEVDEKVVRKVFDDVNGLRVHLDSLSHSYCFVGHSFKFDLKNIWAREYNIPLDLWAHDTQLMAVASPYKVSEVYLKTYASWRSERNKKIAGGSHRPGSRHSLKVLAPYFLKVAPFWEDPTDHANDEYVLLDCEYTYKLWKYFERALREEKTYDFYINNLMPWTKNLCEAEYRGFAINMKEIPERQKTSQAEADKYHDLLDKSWENAYKEYRQLLIDKEVDTRVEKAETAMKKTTKTHLKKILVSTHDRFIQAYALQCEKAATRRREQCLTAISKIPIKMNLNSDSQLLWILRDHLGLNTMDMEGKDSTGKEVLNRLGHEGNEDVKTLLKYRHHNKIANDFLGSYTEMQYNGVIHCGFNPDVARTGRLSSSKPNLQQVPGDLHNIFVARPGYKLATFDESAIEAKLIAYYYSMTSDDPSFYNLVETDHFHDHNAANVFFDLNTPLDQVKAKHNSERKVAKNCGFALLYGARQFRIQATARSQGFEWDINTCRDKYETFAESHKAVFDFKTILDRKLKKGDTIRNLFGRLIHFPDRDEVYMKGFNRLIQSSASDLVQESARRAIDEFRRRDIDAHLLSLVHDEIIIEIPEGCEEEAEEIITKAATEYKLETKFGPIHLSVEGCVSDHWTK